MQISFQLSVVVLGAIIAQGIFASVLLFVQRYQALPNRLLSVLVLLFTLWMCDTFFRVSGIYRQNPNFYLLPIYYSLAFGPLIYFYTRSMTEQAFRFHRRDVLHFVPVILQTGLYIFLQTQNYAYRRLFWVEVHRPYTWDLEFYLSLFSLMIYLLVSVRKVQNYQKWIADRFSEIATISLNWLKIVLACMLALAVFWLLDALLRAWLIYYPQQPLSSIFMGVCVLVFAVGALLQRPLSFSKINVTEKQAVEKLADKHEIESPIIEKIIYEIESQRPYLNSRLPIKEFASSVAIPSRIVSVAINPGLLPRFIYFVNGYRI